MITHPSLMSLLMWFRELALPISACSAVSSHIRVGSSDGIRNNVSVECVDGF